MHTNTVTESSTTTRLEPGSRRWFRALSYASWLFQERRALCAELGISERIAYETPATAFHLYSDYEPLLGNPPQFRGDAVMNLAGVDMEAIAFWAVEAAQRAAQSDAPPQDAIWPDRPTAMWCQATKLEERV